MLYTKTQVAFLMSAQKLFERFPDSMYFWTFTFVKVYPDWWYPAMWNKFVLDLRKVTGRYYCGLRVLEPHPGNRHGYSHGLHYHAIINKRLCKFEVDRIARKHGIGITYVKKCDFGAALYLSKYLTKKGPKLHGVQKWGTMGCYQQGHVRKNSIEIISNYMRARKAIVKGEKVKHGSETLLRGAYNLGGRTRMRKCWNFLQSGKIMSACMLVNPWVTLTPNGGLKYFPTLRPIKVRVVHAVTT